MRRGYFSLPIFLAGPFLTLASFPMSVILGMWTRLLVLRTDLWFDTDTSLQLLGPDALPLSMLRAFLHAHIRIAGVNLAPYFRLLLRRSVL
jgi:hypothetical protein